MRAAILIGSALAIAGAWPAFAPQHLGSGLAAAQSARPAGRDRALIASIQELLMALGYDAGPADGLLGQRTRRAIGSFQSRAGMTPDGAPSEALYARLTLVLNQGSIDSTLPAPPAVAPAAGRPAPLSAEPPQFAADEVPPPSVQGARWRITDADGGMFDLELAAGGRVAGGATSRFWRWEQTGGTIRIVYDNEWGGRVVRTGRLVEAGRMGGQAEGAGARRWQWSAERLSGPADTAAWQATR